MTHQHYLEVEYNSKTLEDIESNAEEEELSDQEADPMHMTPVTPPPDYSSPEDDDDPEETDYLEITRAATKFVEDGDAVCESGDCFPQPPSPNFFTEAPTPEFLGCIFFQNFLEKIIMLLQAKNCGFFVILAKEMILRVTNYFLLHHNLCPFSFK